MARRSNSTRPVRHVIVLEEDDETREIKRFFQRCIAIHAPPSLSKDELDSLLRASGENKPGFEWLARPYKNGLYLVESPNKEWYNRVVAEGRIQLGSQSVTAEAWSEKMDGGHPVIDVWVRVTCLPIGMWIQPVFDILVDAFTRIDEIDPKTLSQEEKRWARIKVGLPDLELLPDRLVVEINSQFHEVRFEAE